MTQPSPESATSGPAQPLAPSYNAKTSNYDTNQLAAAQVPLQAAVDAPTSGQDSSSITPGESCTCIACHEKKVTHDSDILYHCNFADCSWGSNTMENPCLRFLVAKCRLAHVRSHYRQDTNLTESPFLCPVQNCHYKSKRGADLARHTTAKHCNKPAKFECPEIGCKYNGEGNGFTRKDKLTAHKKAMHYGHKAAGQAVRALKPAPASAHAGALGPSSTAADEVYGMVGCEDRYGGLSIY